VTDPGDGLIESLRLAVKARPKDVQLRVLLAERLLGSGDVAGAVAQAAEALGCDPDSSEARDLMLQALGSSRAPGAVPDPPADAKAPGTAPGPKDEEKEKASDTAADPESDAPAEAGSPESLDSSEFDWGAAEEQVNGIVEPRFVESEHVDGDGPDPDEPAYETERPDLRLADVGGMETVKERLEVAFLAPMRNPDLRRVYKKSLSGGLLLYGPPGCGKTFIARAIAGELGAQFIAIGIAQVLDMYIGNSERNLHELFVLARRKTPCVLFLDEVDALGQRRSQTRNSAMRGVVNQLLLELDNVDADNDGLFVLAATNQPWDVDPALRRPGRFDRTVLVLPPDPAARRATLEYHLEDRPIEGIDLGRLVERTDGFSGADLAHLCETAAERALIASARAGEIRMIGMADFESALDEVRPSTGAWLESARGAALFANEAGMYDDLLDYLRQRKML
jgi:AAA+ superfamily predicted ATPase